MAQNYTLMARKNLLKPNETPKYYAVARSGRKVTVKEVCKRITERSSYSKGELEGCIGRSTGLDTHTKITQVTHLDDISFIQYIDDFE